MKTMLEYYDIYPKVLCTHKPVQITIKPLSKHVGFCEAINYEIEVVAMNETLLDVEGETSPIATAKIVNDSLQFIFHFASEQQYMVLVREMKDGNWQERCELRVYALNSDFFELRPYRGDMHCHTCRSDGVESPDIVAANYRKAGFDFLSITDHLVYEPSIEAIRTYENLDLAFRIFPGEEVHPPKNNCHTVHFGGDYSINERIRNDPTCYEHEVNEIIKTLSIPEGLNNVEYASLLWVYRAIQDANGMSIMAHPCWIQDNAYHIRRDMYRYLIKTKPFDALELTCGQSIEENQMQIIAWQQMREDGYAVPLVGSSDSHGTVNSEWFNISKMIVLSKACKRDELIKAVKERRTVVLEQYHGELLPRVYGEQRVAEFVLFLMTEYMPLHDELCFEEGRLMKAYACGDEKAGEILKSIGRRTDLLAEKYWA
jgi:predicted metal-dependent phosphoesterase TrpH